MKKLAIFAASLVFMGCYEGALWTGSMTAHESMAILGPGGEVTLEIPTGSHVQASLFQESNRTWTFEFRDRSQQKSAAVSVPLRSSGFQYGRVYHLKDFGQNFEASVAAHLRRSAGERKFRQESCYDLKYVCDYNWKDGEYQYFCEHKNVPGTRRVDYENFTEKEVIEGEFFTLDGKLAGEFELSRVLGTRERVLRRGSCDPYAY